MNTSTIIVLLAAGVAGFLLLRRGEEPAATGGPGMSDDGDISHLGGGSAAKEAVNVGLRCPDGSLRINGACVPKEDIGTVSIGGGSAQTEHYHELLAVADAVKRMKGAGTGINPHDASTNRWVRENL